MKFLTRLAAALLLVSLLLCPALALELPEDAGLNAEEWEVLLLVNRERLKNGLQPVTATPWLQEACDIRESEIRTLFSHTRPNGTDCFTVFSEIEKPSASGVGWACGENIAAGQRSPSEVMNAWMNSEGHRANILAAEFTHVGVGCRFYQDGYQNYWVQLFYGAQRYDGATSVNACQYTSLRLATQPAASYPVGTTIDAMGLTAVLDCPICGTSYLPLMTELCSGYDAAREGVQSVTLQCFGLERTFSVTIGTAQPTVPETPPSIPSALAHFTDLPAKDYWSYSGIQFAVSRALFKGTSETTFSPLESMQRCMLVTVLWRYEKEPTADGHNFKDIPAGAYYEKAVAWAAGCGIVDGVSKTKFDPEGEITREQLATILYRYCAWKMCAGEKRAELGAFPDANSVQSYAVEPMRWAVAEGLIKGSGSVGADYLVPQGNAAREQVATILMRLIQNILEV